MSPLCIATGMRERGTSRRGEFVGKALSRAVLVGSLLMVCRRGTAERVLELVQKIQAPGAKL